MSEQLFQNNEENYGSLYKEHLFEQYKLYIDSIERVSNKRQSANNYFIAVNTVIISLVSLKIGGNFLQFEGFMKPTIAILGIAVCFIFFFLMKSYKQLNTGKFKVLHQIEKKLPLDLYRYEWSLLGKGKVTGVYIPFSHIERLIPVVFGTFYVFILIIFLAETYEFI